MNKEVFNQIIKDIESNPHKWHISKFGHTLEKGKVEIWVSNGFLYYSIYKPVEIEFSFLQKIKFIRVYHKWKESMVKAGVEDLKYLFSRKNE